MKIENKKPFLWGVGLIFLAAIIVFVPSDGTHAAGSGNMLNNLTLFESVLIFIPSLLLICYGVRPKSKLGVAGGAIVKLYQWVRKNR